MRVVVQRVRSGKVTLQGSVLGEIGTGYVVLVGVREGDTERDARYLAAKCANLRVLEDADGKMNVGLREAGGRVLVVSQFTLYGEAQKGNRPSFSLAARPEAAEPLYDLFVQHLREILGADAVATGSFGGMMELTIVNDGPVTLIIDSVSNKE